MNQINQSNTGMFSVDSSSIAGAAAATTPQRGQQQHDNARQQTAVHNTAAAPDTKSKETETDGRAAVVEDVPDCHDVLFNVGDLFGERRVNHSEPGRAFTWEWPASASALASAHHGPHSIRVACPDSPTLLMAQYVWQSSISLANLLALERGGVTCKGKDIIELGAGAGLPGLVASFCGAKTVSITDYPDEQIVKTLAMNMKSALKGTNCGATVLSVRQRGYATSKSRKNNANEGGDAVSSDTVDVTVSDTAAGVVVPENGERVEHCPLAVLGHMWGTDLVRLPSDQVSAAVSTRENGTQNDSGVTATTLFPDDFDLIIMADTLWMKDQHRNLLTSCQTLLRHCADARVVLTFMHHDGAQEVAGNFMRLAVREFGFDVVQQTLIDWENGDIEDDITLSAVEAADGDASAVPIDEDDYEHVHKVVLKRRPGLSREQVMLELGVDK